MLGAWLPDAVSPALFWGLSALSLIASFITAGFGLGGGALLLAAMASLVPPAALIPVHGVVQLGSNAGRAALFLRAVHWPAVPAFAAGSVMGAVAGGLIAVELPPAAVEIGVGGFVIWSVFATAPRWLTAWPALTGLVSSFLTMFFGATGLFVAAYSRALGLARHAFVATHAALMTLQHALKVAVFGMLGFAYAEWAAVMAAMVVAGGIGTVLGKAMLDRTSDARFRLILDTLLVLISLRLIWQGVRGLT